jgi:hypothetical protein
MKKIQRSFTIGKGFFESSEPVTSEDFMKLTVEELLVQHHRRNAENSCFFIEGVKELDRVMFIIAQDNELIDELKMLKPNRENTLDLLTPSNQNDFTSITLNQLNKQLESNQGDYEIEFDNRSYSFRLVKGIKVKNNLEKIDTYIEEATNMLEYEQFKKVKP